MKTFIAWAFFGFFFLAFAEFFLQGAVVEQTRDIYLYQFENNDDVAQQIRASNYSYNHVIQFVLGGWLLTGILLGVYKLIRFIKRKNFLRSVGIAGIFMLALMSTGCYQPYKPVVLQEIGTNEEGFLIPLQGDTSKQASTNNEQFLRSNLVSTKQVQIPQQWVQTGYNTWYSWNGEWRPAATLIKVDKAPVTREWTAEKNRGTSEKDEAIWVMTADQVEFSTGWVITARIASRDDAVKFLHNYPNGSLTQVLDTEVRSKLQALFGLEVTDLPMDELRKNATPHIQNVVKNVDAFFSERGITITTLGISGGFVYKNASIQEQLVKVFNAEQEKNLAIAATQAQTETNKKIQLAAEAKAKAVLTEQKALADGIKMVADAKAYEIQKAKEDLSTYLRLKQLELEGKKIEKWTGIYPTTYMGNSNPDILLTIPDATKTDKK